MATPEPAVAARHPHAATRRPRAATRRYGELVAADDPFHHLALSQCGLLSRDQILSAGFSRNQLGYRLRTGRWRRLTRNVYDVMPHLPEGSGLGFRRRRSAWIALLAAGSDGIVTGLSALTLHGVWGLPIEITPEFCTIGGQSRRSRPGVRIRRYRKMEIDRFQGHAIASVRAALVQAIPDLARHEAIAVLDSALNRALISSADLVRIADTLRGRRGAKPVTSLMSLVNGLAESPLESHARIQCHDFGIPPPQLQVEVRTPRGEFIARGDLGWRRADGTWLLVEIDGRAYHESAPAITRDRERQNAITLAGRHSLLRFTASDIASGSLAATVARALGIG